MRSGVSWSRSMFGFGVLLALPAAVTAPFNTSFALALAIGVIPAAVSRFAPLRAQRSSLVLVGIIAAVALVCGALLTQIPALAVAVVFAAGLFAPMWAARSRLGALALGLALPLLGIGLSFESPAPAVQVGLLMAIGSLYAWAVSLLWPEHPTPGADGPAPRTGLGALLSYGLLVGIAGALAASIGYLLQLEHVGWVA